MRSPKGQYKLRGLVNILVCRLLWLFLTSWYFWQKQASVWKFPFPWVRSRQIHTSLEKNYKKSWSRGWTKERITGDNGNQNILGLGSALWNFHTQHLFTSIDLQGLATQAGHALHAGESGLLLRLVVEADEAEALAEAAVVQHNCNRILVSGAAVATSPSLGAAVVTVLCPGLSGPKLT